MSKGQLPLTNPSDTLCTILVILALIFGGCQQSRVGEDEGEGGTPLKKQKQLLKQKTKI